jgi:hypothetical protein
MVERGVGKAAGCFVMQARHVGFGQLSWTYDRKSKAKVDEDSDLVVIPSGMTKVLKPLDVIINQPFKVAFWSALQPVDELRPSSRMKHMLLPTVCEWILAAWHSISPEILEKFSKLIEFPMKWTGVRVS